MGIPSFRKWTYMDHVQAGVNLASWIKGLVPALLFYVQNVTHFYKFQNRNFALDGKPVK